MIAMKSNTTNFRISFTSMLRLAIVLGGLFFLLPQEAGATHIVGGNLTYRCLGSDMFGNNRYEIRLTVRRDCLLGAPDAQFDDPASVGFFDGITHELLTFVGTNGELRIDLNNNDTLNEILHSDCGIVMGDVCVHTTTYVAEIILPYRASGYTMAYMRCCRNGSLNNVLNPLSTGMTLVAELSGFAQLEHSCSPQFNSFPPIYVCVNKPLEIDQSAFDPEGDSLVYSLCTPNAGGDQNMNRPQPPFNPPYDPIVFRPPYTLANLMGGVPLTIDPDSGILRGIPNTIGQFVVGICVSAYKNGILTGTTRRDFQFNVRQCRDVPVAGFSAPSLSCESLTVAFDNQSLLADEYLWIFDLNDPNSATSTVFEPTYTYPQGGFYDVALIVQDSGHFCIDTFIRHIGVFDSELTADFTYDVSSCDEDGVILNVTDQTTGFGNIPISSYAWILTVCGDVFPSGAQNPTFPFDLEEPCTAFLAMIVTDSAGCTSSASTSFPVQEITIPVNPEADSICKGITVPLLNGADPGLTYTWQPPNGLDPMDGYNAIAYPGLSTTYYVTVTDGLCFVTDSVHVGVQQLPSLDFTYSTDCKSLVVDFTNTSSNGVLYHWDFGDSTGSDEASPVHTYTTSGNYTITLSSRDGCDVSIDTTITANAITEDFSDTLVNCFKDSIELNTIHNVLYTYNWSPGGFLSKPNVPNPKAGIIDDTKFYVTVTQAGLEGCEILDSVLVLVPDDFTLDAGGDLTLCRFDTIDLLAESNGNVTIVWKDSLGQVLQLGPVYSVSPTKTTKYFITATDTLGCSKDDEVVVFRPSPFEIDITPGDSAYCNIQTITLQVDPIAGVTFEWFNAGGTSIGTGESVDVTPGIATCFRVIGTDTLQCESDEIVCLSPTTFNPLITDNQLICLEEQVSIAVTGEVGQNVTYLWSPGNETTSTITVSPDSTSQFCVEVTNTDVGCKDTLCTDVAVSLIDPLDISIDAIPDTIFFSESVQLIVNEDLTPDLDYEWVASDGEVLPPINNPIATPQNPQNVTYTVTVTNEDGCTATASITITVRNPFCDERDIFIPNAFTPNNDSKNDVLYVRSPYDIVIDLHIYNRWGEEVFSSNNKNIGWDGTFGGEELHPDVFGYYLDVTCPNGEKYFKKGNITLLR